MFYVLLSLMKCCKKLRPCYKTALFPQTVIASMEKRFDSFVRVRNVAFAEVSLQQSYCDFKMKVKCVCVCHSGSPYIVAPCWLSS